MVAACNHPIKQFAKETGLSVEAPVTNVFESDTYDFVGEGEYSIVFNTTANQINQWLSSAAPWNKKWRKGSIPHQIGMHCKFYYPKRVGLEKDRAGKEVYMPNNELAKLFNDTSNYYVARERCCIESAPLSYHKGELLILQPDSNRVWYSS